MRSPEVAGNGSLWIVLAVLFFLLVLGASAMEVLLTTQQSFRLDSNTTLVIEDANSQQGVIWLKLYRREETVDSAVIGLGEHLRYAGKNITLHKIYSGGDSDLVALRIENEKTLASKVFDNESITNMTHKIDSNVISSAHSLIIGENASQRSMAAPGESRSQRYPPFF